MFLAYPAEPGVLPNVGKGFCPNIYVYLSMLAITLFNLSLLNLENTVKNQYI
jgi:hypothetical protein